jgi:hypothetical protein
MGNEACSQGLGGCSSDTPLGTPDNQVRNRLQQLGRGLWYLSSLPALVSVLQSAAPPGIAQAADPQAAGLSQVEVRPRPRRRESRQRRTPRSEIPDRQDSLASASGSHAADVPCILCSDTLDKDKRRHWLVNHMPPYVVPHTYCRECHVCTQTLRDIFLFHLYHTNHSSTAGLTDDNLRTWVYRMNGILHLLKEKFNLSNLQGLLDMVLRDRDSFPVAKSYALSPIMELSIRTWEVCNGLKPKGTYNLHLPNCLAVLTWWKYLQMFLLLLQPEEIEDIRVTAVERLLDGRLVSSVTQSMAVLPRQKSVDCHFHPDLLLQNLKGCSTWAQAVLLFKGRTSYPHELQYMIANLVFPKHFDQVQMLSHYTTLSFTFGLHPRCCSDSGSMLRHMPEVVRLVSAFHSQCVGIGETGLDYDKFRSSDL